MGLPPELLSYAENLFRRFPEEFIALGAPHLEDIFDLRSEGTWSRRILETPTDKTIEIVLRRRHPPNLGHPHAAPPSAQSMPSYGTYWQQPGATSSAAPAYPMPGGGMHAPKVPMHGFSPQSMGYPHRAASPHRRAMDDQTAMRLVYLENQLQALKPQVQAALISQTVPPAHVPPAPTAAPPAAPTVQQDTQQQLQQQPQQQPQQEKQQPLHTSPSNRPAPIQAQRPTNNSTAVQPLPKSHSSPKLNDIHHGILAGDISPDSILRSRRQMPSLGISTVPPQHLQGVQAAPIQKVGQPSHPAVQKLDGKDGPVAAPTENKSGGSTSPKSPRSPGKYSVWKTDWTAPAGNSLDSKRPLAVEVKPQANADTKPDKPNRPDGLNVMRVAKSMEEPESPRSPGRFSAWSKRAAGAGSGR